MLSISKLYTVCNLTGLNIENHQYGPSQNDNGSSHALLQINNLQKMRLNTKWLI